LIKRGNILARALHKWIGLIIGIQMLIWLLTGLYMVIVDIDFIHGDPMVKDLRPAIAIPDKSQVNIARLIKAYPDATRISLQTVMGETHYAVVTPDQRYLIDPITAEIQSPLGEKAARAIARFHFNGDALIENATLITSDPPTEIQTRRLPLWRIDFDDRFSSSFYIDPYSGKLATRRHQYWRIFDVFWMLHIMDYESRTDAHNPLLITAQISGLGFAITGIWLLFYSFGTRRRKRGAAE
jgi:uncharacterized iron-regulated membrane protein